MAFFWNKHKEDDSVATEDTTTDIASVNDSESAFSRGQRVEVTTTENHLLFRGVISSSEDDGLELERAVGEMSFPPMDEGTNVRVRIYSTQGEASLYNAIVGEHSRVKYHLLELDEIEFTNGRSEFRVPLSVRGKLYHREGQLLQDPTDCSVLNISNSGACFSCKREYPEGTILALSLTLVEKGEQLVLDGEIIRVESLEGGKWQYGFLFAKLGESGANALAQQIFRAQQIARNPYK